MKLTNITADLANIDHKARKAIRSRLGIEVTPYKVEWGQVGQFSHVGADTIYVRRGATEAEAYHEMVHEYGHVAYGMLTGRQRQSWHELVCGHLGRQLPEQAADELFARTFDSIMVPDRPGGDDPKAYVQLHKFFSTVLGI